MEQIKLSNRLHWVDVAKGLLIMFVVFQHLPVISEAAGIEHDGVGKLGHLSFLFTCFYMQAFFILTGYCSSFDKPFAAFLKSSFKTIMIPAIFFSFLYYISLAFLYYDFSYVEQMYSIGFIMNGGSKFWFLNALFLLRIMYCLTSNLLQISSSLITGLIYDIIVYSLSITICCVVIKLFSLKYLRVLTGKF